MNLLQKLSTEKIVIRSIDLKNNLKNKPIVKPKESVNVGRRLSIDDRDCLLCF